MVEFLRQHQAIQRVNHMKNARRAGRLVALQMADEMPRSVQVFQVWPLRFPFLDAVFSEVAEARGIRLTDFFRRKRLRDSHQSDLVSAPAGAFRSAGNPLTDALQVRGNCSDFHSHDSDSSKVQERNHR
jgi:hypothetical protein